MAKRSRADTTVKTTDPKVRSLFGELVSRWDPLGDGPAGARIGGNRAMSARSARKGPASAASPTRSRATA